GHLPPELRVIDTTPPVPGVHAVADLLGVHAVAPGRLVGVGLAVPVIRPLAVLDRPAEGVLDLSFRSACGGTVPAPPPQSRQGQCCQGASREESPFPGVHDSSSVSSWRITEGRDETAAAWNLRLPWSATTERDDFT